MTKPLTPAQLRKAMKALNLDEKALADATGVDYSSVTRYLTGKRKISRTYTILVNLLLANGK